MSKIYWNNLHEEVRKEIQEAHDSILIPDGTTITKNEQGVISAVGGGGSDYTLPPATTTTLGGVKPDGQTIQVLADGTIHCVYMPTIRHYQTTKLTDPEDGYRKIFLLDFIREENDFLEVIFNDIVLDIQDFQFITVPEGSAIRLNITEMIDYDTALVHGFLYRGFNILR